MDAVPLTLGRSYGALSATRIRHCAKSGLVRPGRVTQIAIGGDGGGHRIESTGVATCGVEANRRADRIAVYLGRRNKFAAIADTTALVWRSGALKTWRVR